MYGLRGINNIYVANGTGRDSIITRNRDYRVGKEASPSVNKSAMAESGLPCFPPSRRAGPRPPSPARIETLHRGHQVKIKKVSRSASVPDISLNWFKAPGAQPWVSPLEEYKRKGVEPLEGWSSASSWSPDMAKLACASLY
eukprot:TRINITY_DN61724_c0_g1_i1.p1 TRINITY_DN61724_c0_g1~~TRINITY_DN61724_c0_g1_i1.p1  ORF type:complete len:161 (+),score=14.96 TRINITY_DN61724_c0_g1_i1:62-484(+)